VPYFCDIESCYENCNKYQSNDKCKKEEIMKRRGINKGVRYNFSFASKEKEIQ